MGQSLLRLIACLLSIASGTVWVGFAMMVGAAFLEQVQGSNVSYLAAVLTLLACLLCVVITAFFALGIKRSRHGPYSPRLLGACTALGAATLLCIVVLMRSRAV